MLQFYNQECIPLISQMYWPWGETTKVAECQGYNVILNFRIFN